jgi:hypothetical protein
VCGVYPIGSVVGSRSEWDPGINFGGGVGLRIGEHGEFYIESRYHYVWGKTISVPSNFPTGAPTVSGSTSGGYWPLTAGFRF